MSDKPFRGWGRGRIALMARLAEIQAEINQGLPLAEIYRRRQAALGIGYPSFVKLVGRYIGDARPTRRRSRSPMPPPDAAPAPGRPATALPAASSGTAPPPPTRRPGEYDPHVRPEDRRRLLGEED